jgi:hypothetical protein
MSTTVKTYKFYNQDRLGDDSTTESQRSLQNVRYDSYLHSNYFSNMSADEDIQFATSLPAVVPNGLSHGFGIPGAVVDNESSLVVKKEQERNLGRLQLNERPFVTVPYLGRGSCDPDVESELMQGQAVGDKKSVSTVMSQSFMGYTMRPADSKLEQRVQDPKFTVEESALQGWVRGGSDTRYTQDSYRGANSKAY